MFKSLSVYIVDCIKWIVCQSINQMQPVHNDGHTYIFTKTVTGSVVILSYSQWGDSMKIKIRGVASNTKSI